MEIPLLRDIVTIFGLSIAVILFCSRFKIPTLVGFLLTGLLSGPHGLKLIKDPEAVKVLAEMGVVLLLFTIGLEFSLKKLMRIKKWVFVGGGLQVLLTIFAIAGLMSLAGFSETEAIFVGFLISSSSTAITLMLLQQKAILESPQGQASLAILIFQDIAVVPMMLMTPFLGGDKISFSLDLLINLMKGILVLSLSLYAAQKGIPKLLYQIARTNNSQLFILFVLCICFAVAYLTSSIGLSLALGAFLAGLIISESEYSHHAIRHILPFQQVFTSFFFVSIGMLLDLVYLKNHIPLTLFLTLIVILTKFIIASLVALLLRLPLRSSIIVGIALAQVGEFAFILALKGMDHQLIDMSSYQMFLAVSLLTMAASPFLLDWGLKKTPQLATLNLPRWLNPQPQFLDDDKADHLHDHVIICGFGVCGKNLAAAARHAKVPYAVIEMNADIVQMERKKGEPIFFGDAAQEAVLNHVGLQKARLMVIAINDPIATRYMVEVIRKLSPSIYIIARARYLKEIEHIFHLGANDVIAEEFETSIEIFVRVLKKYLIPYSDIDQFAKDVRSNGYLAMRNFFKEETTFSDFTSSLTDTNIDTFRIEETSCLVGKSLEACGLRSRYGLTVLMIRREDRTISNPHPSTILEKNDVLVVFGKPEQLSAFSSNLLPSEA